jgi:hypothetical protein
MHVTEVEELRSYITRVMRRAEHHAGAVNEILLTLAGAILWRKDNERPIRVRTQNGKIKNVLWVYIGGQRYAFSYNHTDGCIEMRRGSLQGPTLHVFTNATPPALVYQIFGELAGSRPQTARLLSLDASVG